MPHRMIEKLFKRTEQVLKSKYVKKQNKSLMKNELREDNSQCHYETVVKEPSTHAKQLSEEVFTGNNFECQEFLCVYCLSVSCLKIFSRKSRVLQLPWNGSFTETKIQPFVCVRLTWHAEVFGFLRFMATLWTRRSFAFLLFEDFTLGVIVTVTSLQGHSQIIISIEPKKIKITVKCSITTY